MATLQELLDLEGVVLAGEFDFDGSMLDYEARIDMSEETGDMNWVPQHGWAYSGGDWTACIGDGGRRGVFVETSKADFNRLFEALSDDR